jgi:hypothetical protein
VPHLLRHGTSVFKVISERPVILPSECHALGEGAITTYFKRLRFDGTSGARTHDLPLAKREHIYALPLGYIQKQYLLRDRLRYFKTHENKLWCAHN